MKVPLRSSLIARFFAARIAKRRRLVQLGSRNAFDNFHPVGQELDDFAVYRVDRFT